MSRALKHHGPPACLHATVTTSARRWERHGVLRTILLMWRLRAAYFLGVDPARLAVQYGRPSPPTLKMTYAACRSQVFAKAPVAGLAKTRLIPALGPRGAARLQRQLTRITLRTAHEAQLGPVTIWCAPDTRHRFFRALQQSTGVDFLVRPTATWATGWTLPFAFNAPKGQSC